MPQFPIIQKNPIMAKTEKWWSYPCEAENGQTIITSGHDGLDKQRLSGKYIYRVEVSWDYPALSDGMPDEEASRLLEQVTDALTATLAEDKVAVMTGIYTGAGRRDWIFYTKNLKIFSSTFNRALHELPVLPLQFEATEDPEWEEYMHLRETTYIPDEE